VPAPPQRLDPRHERLKGSACFEQAVLDRTLLAAFAATLQWNGKHRVLVGDNRARDVGTMARPGLTRRSALALSRFNQGLVDPSRLANLMFERAQAAGFAFFFHASSSSHQQHGYLCWSRPLTNVHPFSSIHYPQVSKNIV